jgi:hypothetical protein
MILNIIQNLPMHKKSKEILVTVALMMDQVTGFIEFTLLYRQNYL